MPVKAIGEYKFPSRDHVDVFGDNRIIYFNWDQHLLFAAPFIQFVPKDMKFGDFIQERIAPLLAPDPQANEIQWDEAQWCNGNDRFTPDFEASLEQNGIGHKDHIRLITPFASALLPSD